MQNADRKQAKRKGTMVLLYWFGIMALLLLLTTATYTWFSLSRTPRVNDMYLTVAAPAGLEIALAHDAPDEEWGQLINFADMVTETSPLRPCTWSDQDNLFYAAIYGIDGRLTDNWSPLSDEVNANTDGVNGYYTMGTFYARSDTAVQVSLGDARVSEDGTESLGTYLIGTPVWNDAILIHDDGGQGAEYAMRIGLRLTPIDKEGQATGDSVFIIYEPNCDGHVDGSTGYVETPNINGGDSLVPQERLITQSTSTWSEVYPVQRTATLRDMGGFTSDNTALFALEAGGLEKIDVYIWLEGQDVDCSNLLSTEAQILASLLFDADYSSQSGMVDIGD